MVTNRLYRSRTDRLCTGVCGGLGEYFNVDPTLARLFFVVTTILTGGLMLLVYLVMWIIVPEAPFGMDPSWPPEPARTAGEENADPADPLFDAGNPSGSGFTSGPVGSTGFFDPSRRDQINHHRREWMGWAFVAFGALVLMHNLNLLGWLNLHATWPAFLIVAGVLLLMRQRSRY